MAVKPGVKPRGLRKRVQTSSTEFRRVLFVCAGNTCRSPMAAAIARRMLGSGVKVESAGLEADEGSGPTRDAVRVMKEHGLDIRDHSSRQLRLLNAEEFDLVIGLTKRITDELRRKIGASERVKSLDPYGRGIEVYRATAVAIELQLERLFGVARW